MQKLLITCLLASFFNGLCLCAESHFPYAPTVVLTDTIPPQISCPADLVVNLLPTKCDSVLQFLVSAEDDQDSVSLSQITGLPSGAAFPMGVTVNTYLATDLAGNTASCAFSITVNGQGVQQLNCWDGLYVRLDQNCEETLLPMKMLLGLSHDCPLTYIVAVDKTLPFGDGPWLPPTFNRDDIGMFYQARVTSTLHGNSCQGSIAVIDGLMPTLICQDISVPCALTDDQLSPQFLRDSLGLPDAYPIAFDECADTLFALTFYDVIFNFNYPCGDTSNLVGTISRHWQAWDGYNSKICIQTIRRTRLLADVVIPETTTTPCRNPDFSLNNTGLPFINFYNRKFEITDSVFCGFEWAYFDTIQPATICVGNYIVERTWKIYDECQPLSASNPKIGIQHILVQDTQGPALKCPEDITVAVADNNCRAAINLPDVYLSDNCTGIITVEALWADSSLTKMLAGSIVFEGDSTDMDTLAVFGVVSSFPVGTTVLQYLANDECGNTGECSFNLTLANFNPPLANCDTLLMLELSSSGALMVPATLFDNGATDDCTPLFFKAKMVVANTCQTDPSLNDSIRVCCQFLGDTVLGILRVYDIPVPLGALALDYGSGHFSDCNFRIVVHDSFPPLCTLPPDITLSCEAFDPSLEAYSALLTQSCSVDSIQRLLDLSNFDTLCSRGTIFQQFKVFDGAGEEGTCSQKIVVDYNQEYYIRFPDDALLLKCDSIPNFGEPVFFGENCKLLAVTFSDIKTTVIPDACFKIERTWKIINWCTYDPGKPIIKVGNPQPNPISNHADNRAGPIVSPVQAAGDPWKSTISKIKSTDAAPTNFSVFYDKNANGYEYVQIVKFIDTVKPIATNCPLNNSFLRDTTLNDPLLWNAAYWLDPVTGASDLNDAPVSISVTATDDCAGKDVRFEYELYLDLNGDGMRETIINSYLPPPAGMVKYNNFNGIGFAREFDFRPVPSNQKWRFAMQEVVSGNHKTAAVRFNTDASPNTYEPVQLPFGTHRIKWRISDGCGNDIFCDRTFKVGDGVPPVVACLPQIAINLNSDGLYHLYPNEVRQNASDNYSPAQSLKFGLRKSGTGVGFPADSNGNPILNVTYNCFEIGPQTVELWAKDEAGNASFCMTTVTFQDSSGICNPGSSNLDGHIKTVLLDGIEGVHVRVDAPNAPYFSGFYLTNSRFTDSTGYYDYGIQFDALPQYPGTFVVPSLDINPLNGVTTYDLVLISKHILGIEPLSSPYNMIAADANKSGSVTTFDIVEIRKLILGIYQELPGSESWRFVPKSHVFLNPMNPFQPPFPEQILFNELLNNSNKGSFVGIKIGDVNNTAVGHAAAPPDERSAGTLHFQVAANGHEALQAGELIELQFTTEVPMQGCQFTLNTYGLEVLDILPGENMEREHFALFPEKNALTMAWEKGGIANFTLKCKATKTDNLREMLSIGSRITKAEAYRENSSHQVERFQLALRFPDQGSFELFQNRPNPFAGDTEISFNLPESCTATLTIYDVHGRVLYTQTGDYAQGVNTISIGKSALEASGVLYYRIETARHSGTRKMFKN